MSDFEIAETKIFQKNKTKFAPKLYKKIRDVVYPQLRLNPYFGLNIKKLKGQFSGYYRYRLGSYRLFYLIENNKLIVVVVDLKLRKNAYKLK